MHATMRSEILWYYPFKKRTTAFLWFNVCFNVHVYTGELSETMTEIHVKTRPSHCGASRNKQRRGRNLPTPKHRNRRLSNSDADNGGAEPASWESESSHPPAKGRQVRRHLCPDGKLTDPTWLFLHPSFILFLIGKATAKTTQTIPPVTSCSWLQKNFLLEILGIIWSRY